MNDCLLINYKIEIFLTIVPSKFGGSRKINGLRGQNNLFKYNNKKYMFGKPKRKGKKFGKFSDRWQ